MSEDTKVIIIGLDGATWDLLKPWADNGQLPTIKKLMNNGIWGKLESTVPPITSPAWLSLATGMNPGKLGVFDFLSRKGNDYRLHAANSSDLRGKAIWDYISADRENKVVVMSYPTLFPPYSVNGIMVSKLVSTHLPFTVPQSFTERLNEVCEGYEDLVPYHKLKYDDTDLFLTDLNRVTDKQMKAVRYLQKEPWNLFIYVFSATDWAQHLMWKYIDSEHRLYDRNNSPRYQSEFLKFWHKIDAFLDEIVETNKDANLFVVSDHGFGPQDECFNLAKYLEKKGYLVRKSDRRARSYIVLKSLIHRALKVLERTKLGQMVPERVISKVGTRLKNDIINEIDFEKSKAYILGHTIPFGAIYLNLEDRDPQGIVREEDYALLKSRIKNELRNLKHDIDQNVGVQLFDPKEIYSGVFMDKAPDIIFTIDNWRCIVNESTFNGPLFKNEAYSNRHTGSHRLNGIVLACGPDIRHGSEIQDAKIWDIAPTILHIMGLPVPADMDGRVLREIFREGSGPETRETRFQKVNHEKDKIRSKVREIKKSGEL